MSDLEKPAAWVGRTVLVADCGEHKAVVLAVDDTSRRPAAWVRLIIPGQDLPMYRSTDLADLTDVETGEQGPRGGTAGASQETA